MAAVSRTCSAKWRTAGWGLALARCDPAAAPAPYDHSAGRRTPLPRRLVRGETAEHCDLLGIRPVTGSGDLEDEGQAGQAWLM